MLQFVIVGLVLGSIYALAASGLVITYVSTGVLNFAFGSLAYFIARTYYWIHIEKGWGILPSAFLCLFVISPLLGLLLYIGIFRFLRLSSQLIKVVVTIGLFVAVPQISNIIFGQVEIFFTPGLAPGAGPRLPVLRHRRDAQPDHHLLVPARDRRARRARAPLHGSRASACGQWSTPKR